MPPFFRTPMGIVLLFGCLFLFLGAIMPPPKAEKSRSGYVVGTATAEKAAEPEPKAGEPEIGETVTLTPPAGGESFLVARDAEAFNELMQAVQARDQYGAADLLQARRAILLSRPVAALYLKHDWDARVARITEGEHEGEKVWVMPACLKRS